ncbi:MAG: hypothetical protein ACO3YY_00135, partial [Phycisphaerales bacterium]
DAADAADDARGARDDARDAARKEARLQDRLERQVDSQLGAAATAGAGIDLMLEMLGDFCWAVGACWEAGTASSAPASADESTVDRIMEYSS